MPIDFKSIFDITKVPSKFFAAFSLSSGFILFCNDEFIKKLRLENFLSEFGYIITLVFLVSSSILILNLILFIYNKISNYIDSVKYKKYVINNLENLDVTEIMVLRLFYIVRANTLELPIKNQVISALLDKKILKINNPVGNSFFVEGFDYRTSVSLTSTANKNLDCIIEKLTPKATEIELEQLRNLGFNL
ncbi:superinfection exclusion B family protein [Elizabethkingia anophelis]|nr:superinfection exclusion B family protein [Elizabethkingia anophelis]MCT4170294.1 superinfection exclusion B family protein [Elizabethkingia anophelis]MCT4244806.1 superinfection exclusion B family protein [Elizabethkingia anophelis]MCT4248444.1 superinfection exclusion B family protein [Elizabethkingia anophelis]MCT4259434.1 superinfection exclusion B family protein [Elizabethkingia anophelis]